MALNMRAASLFFIFFLLSACGGGESNIGSSDGLLGTWKSNCYVYSHRGSNRYAQNTYIFKSDVFLLDRIYYQDSQCDTQSGSGGFYSGDYKVGLTQNAEDGSEVIRITMESINSENPNQTEETSRQIFQFSGRDLMFGTYSSTGPSSINNAIIYSQEVDGKNIACTDSLEPGIRVTVLDSISEEEISCGSSIEISGVVYEETDTSDASVTCFDGDSLEGAYERHGRYNVKITKAGYQPWEKNNVIVTGDSCHVDTVELIATLIAED